MTDRPKVCVTNENDWVVSRTEINRATEYVIIVEMVGDTVLGTKKLKVEP